MRDLIISIFGQYQPVMTSVELSDGTLTQVVASGAAGVDWVYIGGVLLFALTLYCVLRILGAVISRV